MPSQTYQKTPLPEKVSVEIKYVICLGLNLRQATNIHRIALKLHGKISS